MRKVIVSKETITKNLKANKKIVIGVFITGILLGILIGVVDGVRYDKNRGAVEKKDAIELLDLSSLENDEKYYDNAFNMLKQRNDYLKACFEYFQFVDLSDDSRNIVNNVEVKHSEYQETFSEAIAFYKEKSPIKADKIDETIMYYESKIQVLNDEIDKLNKTLDEILSERYTDGFKEEEQNRIANEIHRKKNDIVLFENHVNTIKATNHASLVESEIEANDILNANIYELNELTRLFNEAMREIATNENYNIVYNEDLFGLYYDKVGINDSDYNDEEILDNRKDQAIIYATSMAGLDEKRERFFSILTFFALFSVVLSVLIGAVFEPSGGK